MSGMVGNKNVEILRDSGCNEIFVKGEFVDEADFLGIVGYMMAVNQTLIRAPIPRIEVDKPFYRGTFDDMCMVMFWTPGGRMIRTQSGE